MVSDILGVGGGEYDGLELGRGGFELRPKLILIPIQGFGFIADACESTASFLHIIKLSHYIGKYRIASFGRNVCDVNVLSI